MILTSIFFQMGWNHQLGIVFVFLEHWRSPRFEWNDGWINDSSGCFLGEANRIYGKRMQTKRKKTNKPRFFGPCLYMDVSENSGFSPQIIPCLIGFSIIHHFWNHRKLTWNLKMMVSNKNLLFQGFIFRFHVSFPGCIHRKTPVRSTWPVSWSAAVCRKRNIEVFKCHIVTGTSEIQTGFSRWWFQIFFISTPTWGRFPFWVIFFNWVETTN